MESFAPAIVVDGKTVTPKGYEWVLGFALRGCDWAIKKAREPEFLEVIRADVKKDVIKRLEMIITDYEQRILEIKLDINRNT